MIQKKQKIGYIAYYRASTEDQTLTIEGQRDICNKFAAGLILTEFVEHESGSNDDRPQLQKAIEECQIKNAVLIVARLDRLSRRMIFIAKLLESNINFIACDMPDASHFTLHIFAALAQHERELISVRTKKALEILKSKGVRLGNPQNFSAEARKKGGEANKFKSIHNPQARVARAMISEMIPQKLSLLDMAGQLNEAGVKTRNGKRFHPTTVLRFIEQINNLSTKTVHH